MQVAIGELKPYPGNARRGNQEMIRASLVKHGQYRPIVVQKSTSFILAGNNTWLAAQAEGWEDIDVHYVDVDDDAARRINLIDNKANDEANYDNAALAELLQSLEGNFDGTGYIEDDLNALLDSLLTKEERQDIVPPVGIAPSRVADGDVWICGNHRVICGDSTDAGVQQRLLGDEVVDLVVIDPPYGVSYQEGLTEEEAKRLHRRTDGLEVPNDNLGKEGTEQLIFDALTIVPLKQGGCVYIFAPQGDMYPIIWNAVQMAGITLKQSLVWVKQRFAFGRSDYHYRHEMIMYGWKEGSAHYFVDDRTQDSVWEFDNPQASKEHPTMKPVDLVKKAVKNSAQRGEIVLDLFGGSGTTMLACEVEGRTARLVELSPLYCEVIISRWEAFTGNKAHREDDDV